MSRFSISSKDKKRFISRAFRSFTSPTCSTDGQQATKAPAPRKTIASS